MRIIGGRFKGRKFNPPAKNWPTRPTTDFSKEALFNILLNRIDIEETKVLDLFGGTGNHSYEFISRGATDVTYVDKFNGCVQFVKKTAKELDIESSIRILRSDVFKFINRTSEQYDFIIADPPYDLSTIRTIPDLIFKQELLKTDGLFVLEHGSKDDFEGHERFSEARKYGQSVFSFFS